MTKPEPTFTGEVQFRRWSDSSTQGVQVTFALPDTESLEPLKDKAGKRFMAVLVEIGDDEQPVQPMPRKDIRGPLCREACDYCVNKDFQDWLDLDATGCKDFILETAGVESRKELDENKEARDRFVQQVRIPFFVWQRERK